MKPFMILATVLLAVTCSALPYGAISTQYQSLDHHGQYAYGYADPNSQKHESRSADGTTHGGYSYLDGHGHLQSVSYVADPHTGFHVSGTNLPKGPEAHVPVVAYHGAPQHIYGGGYGHHHVALTHQGVPIDTPEVQHAKAVHFAAHAEAAHNGLGYHNGAPQDTPEVAHAKAEHFAAHAAARSGHHLYKRSLYGYGHHGGAPWGGYHVPVIHNGVPVETPEVQHAKAAHFAAHAQAAHGAGHYNGAPADTPEVAHAKAEHFAAHAAARSGGHGAVYGGHHGGYHVPVIHNGVPVDTPEVQHAKAAHFAAVAQASHGAGHHGGDDGQYYDNGAYNDGGHYDDGAHYYGAGGGGGHHGPIHIPVIHNGVPVETPEVQHAKAAHYAAVAEAQSRGHGHGGYAPAHHDGGHYDDGQYHNHHNQW